MNIPCKESCLDADSLDEEGIATSGVRAVDIP